MERMRRTPGARVKKKMTREQMQLAIIKKKESDAKALKIVERLVEPQVDPKWLVENLQNINKCHMEDVIEERAITKVCGYVLCQKPLTVIIKQQYHISLRDKKVYDVTKRKNFCSSSCFGASNYLLEQMLTSPLWLRDKEEIPQFRIFSRNKESQNISHGEEVNIALVVPYAKDSDCERDEKTDESSDNVAGQTNKSEPNQSTKEISGCLEEFVLETVKNINFNTDLGSSSNTDTNTDNELKGKTVTEDNKLIEKDVNSSKSIEDKQKEVNHAKAEKANNICGYEDIPNSLNNNMDTNNIEQLVHNTMQTENEGHVLSTEVKINVQNTDNSENNDDTNIIQHLCYLIGNKGEENCETLTERNINVQNNGNSKNQHNTDTIVQHVNSVKQNESEGNCELSIKRSLKVHNSDNSENKSISPSIKCDKILVSDANKIPEKLKTNEGRGKVEEQISMQVQSVSESPEKSRIFRKKKRTQNKAPVDINLAARVEASFHEWIAEESTNFLFGDDSIRKKEIEKIEHQDRYSILCEKLNRLQFQDEQEDATILEKPTLKPTPHFAILKEEGQKLDLKVRAFYEGRTTIEEPKIPAADKETGDNDTYLPLTDIYAPLILRRRIFLEKLDQIIPDLLKTLTGNNYMYAEACANYTSVKCVAFKALVNTFTLSASNIIFKTAEWTLVGLVIIKMLSLVDPWLATLLASRKANMYISMILTSYKLDPHYLNLFVTSFNPNVNPK